MGSAVTVYLLSDSEKDKQEAETIDEPTDRTTHGRGFAKDLCMYVSAHQMGFHRQQLRDRASTTNFQAKLETAARNTHSALINLEDWEIPREPAAVERGGWRRPHCRK